MRKLLGVLLAVSLIGAAIRGVADTADLASLVADSVRVPSENLLVAEGNVELLYQGDHLRAKRISYDKTTERITVEGPITLVSKDGKEVLLADQADLSSDLQNGILRSARLVLNQQLQLAAAEMSRINGRYTRLDKTVASSCKVCEGSLVPIWEIRAKEVVHDNVDHQLYFDEAQLRIAGVPVFYLPRLRLPDPTVTRVSGFLLPSLSTSSGIGTGIRVPYFLTLGPSRDLTFAPTLYASGSASLGMRYRQVYSTGTIQIDGAITRDTLIPGQTRGYLFASGGFALPNDFRLSFSVQEVSDQTYLSDYGLPQADRLSTGIELTRTRRDTYTDARALHYYSLRPGDDNATIPSDVADARWIHRFEPAFLGGQATLQFSALGLLRTSGANVIGRDVSRGGVKFDWQRSWISSTGIVATAQAEFSADFYAIGQDTNFPRSIARTNAIVATELRWPWVRATAGGASQVFEPIAQFIWSPVGLPTVPNEDSVLAELDPGNLWSLNHFDGIDGVEQGARANIGFSWTRFDPAGWSAGLTAGRIYRASPTAQFTPGSGLGTSQSDWLVAGQLKWPGGFTLTNRSLFDDRFSFSKNETRLDWNGPRLNLSTSYVFMVADPAASLPNATRDITLATAYRFDDRWRGALAVRYDLNADRADSAAITTYWRNECLSVDLSLSRSFGSSTTLGPSTTFSLSVGLLGFGANNSAAPVRAMCRQ